MRERARERSLYETSRIKTWEVVEKGKGWGVLRTQEDKENGIKEAVNRTKECYYYVITYAMRRERNDVQVKKRSKPHPRMSFIGYGNKYHIAQIKAAIDYRLCWLAPLINKELAVVLNPLGKLGFNTIS